MDKMIEEIKECREMAKSIVVEVDRLKTINTALLEALQDMLRIHTGDMYDAGFNPPTCHCGLCNNAREAIHKAKGE